jgi:glutamate-1-semialdehyde 2,1-aminomutase
LKLALEVNQIVVATSTNEVNRPLVEHIKNMGFACELGSENDVLDRYIQVGKKYEADIIVRITGDCPLIDPDLVDEAINHFKIGGVDYLCNNYPPTYPDGLDIEVFAFSALERSFNETNEPLDREHVTPYLRKPGKFKTATIKYAQDLSNLRWPVDELDGFKVIENVFLYFHPRVDFRWEEILALQKTEPHLFTQNKGINRNEGAFIGSGQKLWKRAKNIIPGGNMLLSKRAEMFLPDKWPSYFSKSKGCMVWDLDGCEYIDMCIMGVGTNTLGYGHPEVDHAVQQVVIAGNMATFNCPEEVYLAEKLVKMHPWANMVRFARSGGEANAIAIRIARAASGRDKVAICGYHGWHDWYLATNLGDKNKLTGHLLPGLEPRGVPQNLGGTVLPFQYNALSELEVLVRENKIAAIMMEVSRNTEPEQGFLKSVRKLATENDIILIFDECTSGFRQTFGGLHKLYNVEPDMAIFGKALGNGYAITSVIGRREIMEAAQTTFISSTFWTERIGPVAALKTLEVMEREKSWELITETGRSIGGRWKALADKYELNLKVSGLPSMTGFSIESPNMNKYKTLITQEMLKNNFLATNVVYTCTEHTQSIIDRYFDALEPIFSLINECEKDRNIDELLESPVCHSGFKRLN